MHRQESLGRSPRVSDESSTPPNTPSTNCEGAAPQPRCKSLVLADGPNLTTVRFHSNGGNAYHAVADFDFRGVRTRLTHRYGPLHCEWVVAARPGRDLRARGRYLGPCGWILIEANGQPSINRDPADAYILDRMQVARSMLAVGPFERVVLMSHDGGFAKACAAFAEVGGNVAICGFLGSISNKLRALAAHPRVELLDLNRDFGAVRL